MWIRLLSLSVVLTADSPAVPSNHRLWYEQPAETWQTDALPIGNGNLGAMLFGQVSTERILLNEDSMWIGDESDTGSYQALGDLFVTLHPEASQGEVSTDAPATPGETIEQAFDDDPATKWCVENRGAEVTALVHYPGDTPELTRYAITSGNDVPGRDPKDWDLEGSNDGRSWKLLDSRRDVETWKDRGETREFALETPATFRSYRLVFKTTRSKTHFQVAGIRLGGPGSSFDEYRRQLDIDTAVHRTSYLKGGIRYRREAFASHPAGVMVFHFSADKPGAHSGSIELADAHDAESVAKGNTIIAAGNLAGFVYNKPGRQTKGTYQLALDYETQVRVLHDGGEITAAGGGFQFHKCDSLTILVAADTNYLNRRDQQWKGPHPHRKLTSRLDAAARRPVDELRKEHIAEYRTLYERLQIELPGNANGALPTDRRLLAYQNDRSDLDLEALVLRYARYLMISCSRPGSLPANLQGLWNPDNNPPWRCDYHSDVNLQMNYWFTDPANLSETFKPYADYQSSVREVRRENTRKKFGENIRGWATRSENGIFGGASYLWVPGDAAWLAQNLWDHYAYTRDKGYLAEIAYPILKELCEFWEDYLIELPDGTLVSPESVSPEHGPKAVGNSYEQQLVHDLFTNFIEASSDLGVDADYRGTVAGLRDKLLKPKIGRWGQLQEWMEDRDDPKDQHRHVSHMIAVYPGRQIAPTTTPELAKAAAVSLDARGDGGTGWAIVWKSALWARLLDGDRAHKLLRNSLKNTTTTAIVMNHAGGTYPNLLMAHPPFQIDSNFGYAAAFLEMLMQSHLGEIHLLPALPAAWPDGKITGLKARGNHTLDIEWAGGKLTSATITSPPGSTPKIRIGDESEPVDPESDPRIRLRR